MPQKCCPECIGDRGLTNNIFPTLDRSSGTCSFCGSEGDDLVLPIALRDYFELLAAAYEEEPGGTKTLAEWLIEDWKILNHTNLDLAQARLLLAEILDDGEMARKFFKPFDDASFTPVADWDTLKDELRYQNRYFLDEQLNKERLKALLPYLISDPLPTTWYRARIMTSSDLYPIDQMGAPPKGIASHGRANPSGIPYLYLASTPETGISEIRPHTGEMACVAKFKVPDPSGIVDLRNPRKLVSPLILQEASEIVQLRADLPFLEKLGAELTRPILPRSAAIDYVPSQFLCEFIKKQNFSGVLYDSSVSDGMNLALFNVETVEPLSVSRFMVHRVSVDVALVQ